MKLKVLGTLLVLYAWLGPSPLGARTAGGCFTTEWPWGCDITCTQNPHFDNPRYEGCDSCEDTEETWRDWAGEECRYFCEDVIGTWEIGQGPANWYQCGINDYPCACFWIEK